MNEVERLNYVNGRRLEAGDLRIEQDYFVEIRRMLNRGLFTPGIVSGLEVTRVKGSGTMVTVAPGLALDPLGREIVLLDQPETARALRVPARRPMAGAGYFLVIRYAEERRTGEDPDCGPPISEAARIRERPRLEWTEEYPSAPDCGRPGGRPLDCGIVLAFVSLDDACEIRRVDVGSRILAHPAQTAQVHQLALEGEKDIDKDNPKVLHFVIRGGAPQSVVLFLWADRFSSLYYTEMGRHTHRFDKETGSAETSLAGHTHSLSAHTHPLTSVPTTLDGGHGHKLFVDSAGGFDATKFPTIGREGVISTHQPVNRLPEYVYKGGVGTDYVEAVLDHGHTVSGSTGGPSATDTGGATPTAGTGKDSHTHKVPDTVFAGVNDLSARTEPNETARRYFDDLIVELDGVDVTAEIEKVLPSAFAGRRLANVLSPQHPLVTEGTPGIELTTVAGAVNATLDVGSHTLTFRTTGGGGKVLYNLFVE